MVDAIKTIIKIVKSNIENRKQTMKMANMTFKKRYAGSGLGIAWSLVKPILFILVYWFAIEIGIRGGKPVGGSVPYIFWLMAGIIAWFFMSDILNQGCAVIRKDSHLVTKVVFPVETIPTFHVLSFFYVHLMLFALVTVTLAIAGYYPTIYYLQFIYYTGFMLLFCFVLCTFLSTLAVISRDFEHLIKSTSMIFFWLSPVIWSTDKLRPGSLLIRVIKLNPFYYFIQGYRDTFIYGKWFWERPYHTLYIIVFMILFTLLTGFLYSKLRDDFSDVL